MIMSVAMAMKENPYPGVFTAFEGIDGSGKTTQAELLVALLHGMKLPVFPTKEPTEDGIFGKLVRNLYSSDDALQQVPQILRQFFQSDDYNIFARETDGRRHEYLNLFESTGREIEKGKFYNLSWLIQLGMIFDRHEHRVRDEIPALGSGTHIVSDRDFLSTLAYGAGDGLLWRELLTAHEEILEDAFIVPDLIFLIDVPPDVGFARTMIKQSGRKEQWDSEERQTKIRDAYLEVTNEFNAMYPAKTSPIDIMMIDGNRDKEIVHQEIAAIVKGFL